MPLTTEQLENPVSMPAWTATQPMREDLQLIWNQLQDVFVNGLNPIRPDGTPITYAQALAVCQQLREMARELDEVTVAMRYMFAKYAQITMDVMSMRAETNTISTGDTAQPATMNPFGV